MRAILLNLLVHHFVPGHYFHSPPMFFDWAKSGFWRTLSLLQCSAYQELSSNYHEIFIIERSFVFSLNFMPCKTKCGVCFPLGSWSGIFHVDWIRLIWRLWCFDFSRTFSGFRNRKTQKDCRNSDPNPITTIMHVMFILQLDEVTSETSNPLCNYAFPLNSGPILFTLLYFLADLVI